MATLINDDVSSPPGKGSPSGLTPEDLELGRRAVKFVRILSAIALVAAVGITLYVFMSVPWETRLPYSGRFGRNGLSMQVAMAMCLAAQFIFWRISKSPTAHHMGKTSRVACYILPPLMIAGAVWGQWILAVSILVEGGALPG